MHVHIEGWSGVFALDPDDRLDLTSLELDPHSTAINGVRGLVDVRTGITKRSFLHLCQQLPEPETHWGSQDHPLRIQGSILRLVKEATALPNLVVATAKERDFAARVHSCTITSNLLKAGEGTYFMGDVHYGFTSSLEEEDKRTAMLCIPPHYRRLWDKIQELRGNLNCKGFIVLGNPGIGKSHFCVYAAVRLLMEGKSVLWHMPGRFALYESGAVEGLTEEAANKVLRERSDVCYLADGVKPLNVHQASPVISLLAHSPSRDNYKPMQRREETYARVMYLPEWTTEDMDILRQKAFPRISRLQMEKRMQMRGGVPRAVLATAGQDQDHETVKAAIGRSSWQSLDAMMTLKDGATDGFSHQLGMIKVPHWEQGDFSTTHVEFASASIGHMCLREAIAKFNVDLTAFIAAGGSSQVFQTFKGLFYEKHVFYAWASGAPFQARDLIAKPENAADEAAHPSSAAYTLVVPAMQLRSFGTPITVSTHAAAHPNEPILYVPVSKTFKSVDAICPADKYGIQATVSPSHALKSEGLRTLFNVVKGTDQVTVYIVVPSDVFPKWKWRVNIKLEDFDPPANATPEEIQASAADKLRAKNLKQVVVAYDIVQGIGEGIQMHAAELDIDVPVTPSPKPAKQQTPASGRGRGRGRSQSTSPTAVTPPKGSLPAYMLSQAASPERSNTAESSASAAGGLHQ